MDEILVYGFSSDLLALDGAVRETLTRLQQDDDGIPVWTEEKQYRPVPVPDDLPPVDEVRVSFDGGKTHWVFVASHLAEGGGL